MRPILAAAALLLALAPSARADVSEFTTAALPPEPVPAMVSPLVLAGGGISSFGEPKPKQPRKDRKRVTDPTLAPEAAGLGPERARILLRSLTIPGWGQATLGHRHAAAYFAVAEAGVWSAFTAFRVQEVLRRQSYERTAQLFAGIDLRGRDEEYRRIVGAFVSSEEYNLLVVSRDAANLYLRNLQHPDMVGYRAYIAAHSLGGSDGWNWSDGASFDRYRAQRKNSQRASLRANTALGLAIANRLVSALHAARVAGRDLGSHPPRTSWNFNFAPGQPGERVLVRAGLSARF